MDMNTNPAGGKSASPDAGPIRRRLESALLKIGEQLLRAAQSLIATGPDADGSKRIVELRRLVADYAAMASLFARREPSAAETLEAIEFLTQGLPAEKKLEHLRKAGNKSRGRPPTMRLPSIQALEMREAGYSWPQVARQLCQEKGCKHGRQCKERFRINATHIKNLLKRYEA